MNEKFNFRGSPSNEKDFYMLAILKKDKVSNFKSANTPNFDNLESNNKDKYFFLCQNQYDHPDGLTYQRLYWSSDPDDFQKSTNENHLNQGVVRVNSYTVNSQRVLRYRTTFSSSPNKIPEPGVYKNFGTDLENLTGSESSFLLNFNKKSSDYNLNNSSLYYSIPYSVNTNFSYLVGGVASLTGNQIEWVFRKIKERGASSSEPKVTIPKPTTAKDSENIYNFVDIETLNTTAGIEDSYFNYGCVKYVNVEGLSAGVSFQEGDKILYLETHDPAISNFPQHYTDLRIQNAGGTSSSVIYYDSIIKNGTSLEIVLNDAVYSRGLIGSDFEIDVGTELTLNLNLRNHEDCFCKLGTTSDFNEYFDIYLIPTEETAIFPSGHILSNHTFFPTCASDTVDSGKFFTPEYGTPELSFYNDKSRKPHNDSSLMTTANRNKYISDSCSTVSPIINLGKLNSYRKIYNLLFFKELGVLNTDIWSNTGITAFPSIAKHSSFPITFYTWDVWEAARQAHMYDYCNSFNYCGFCFGLNQNAENICFVDNLTRKHAVLTSSTNVLPPLAANLRTAGSNNTVQDVSENSYDIAFYVFLGLFGAWIILAVTVYHKDEKVLKRTNIVSTIVLILFMTAILVYMDSVGKSLTKCESNQTASCPTFSNPNRGDNDNFLNHTQYILPDGTRKPLIPDPY